MNRLLLSLRRRLAVWLFPQFGDEWQQLKHRHEGEVALRVIAQDRMRDLEAELRRVNEELAASRKETTHALMLVGDWFSQQMFGRKIFSAAPDLPEQKLEPELLLKRRQQGRVVAEELERRFYESFDSQVPETTPTQ